MLPNLRRMENLKALAHKFLEESVFAAREAQHGGGPTVEAGGCGLGARPVIPASFNKKQADLMEEMIGVSGGDAEIVVAAAVQHAEQWIKLQDGLDRKRNHFLKDFRNAHGFDRKQYPPDVEARFKQGIDAVNQENRSKLDAAADAVCEAIQALV